MLNPLSWKPLSWLNKPSVDELAALKEDLKQDPTSHLYSHLSPDGGRRFKAQRVFQGYTAYVVVRDFEKEKTYHYKNEHSESTSSKVEDLYNSLMNNQSLPDPFVEGEVVDFSEVGELKGLYVEGQPELNRAMYEVIWHANEGHTSRAEVAIQECKKLLSGQPNVDKILQKLLVKYGNDTNLDVVKARIAQIAHLSMSDAKTLNSIPDESLRRIEANIYRRPLDRIGEFSHQFNDKKTAAVAQTIYDNIQRMKIFIPIDFAFLTQEEREGIQTDLVNNPKFKNKTDFAEVFGQVAGKLMRGESVNDEIQFLQKQSLSPETKKALASIQLTAELSGLKRNVELSDESFEHLRKNPEEAAEILKLNREEQILWISSLALKKLRPPPSAEFQNDLQTVWLENPSFGSLLISLYENGGSDQTLATNYAKRYSESELFRGLNLSPFDDVAKHFMKFSKEDTDYIIENIWDTSRQIAKQILKGDLDLEKFKANRGIFNVVDRSQYSGLPKEVNVDDLKMKLIDHFIENKVSNQEVKNFMDLAPLFKNCYLLFAPQDETFVQSLEHLTQNPGSRFHVVQSDAHSKLLKHMDEKGLLKKYLESTGPSNSVETALEEMKARDGHQ